MNLPNKLTLSRVFCIPVFLLFSAGIPEYFAGALSVVFPGAAGAAAAYNEFIGGAGRIAAGVIFVAAFATDAIDGYIARKYSMATDFGAFLDPLADKLLVAAALFVLVSRGELGAWIPALIISREFIVTGLRLLAINKGVVLAAGKLGKAKTVVQFAAITLLLFRNFNLGVLAAVNAGYLCMLAAFILTVISGAEYLIKNRTLFSTK